MSPEEIAILAALETLRPGRTASPEEIARAVAAGGEPDAWRRRLPHVKQAAKHLARTGQIAIYRKGKVANPDDFKGVWRIGPPVAASETEQDDGDEGRAPDAG